MTQVWLTRSCGYPSRMSKQNNVSCASIVHKPSIRFFKLYEIGKARSMGQNAMLTACNCIARTKKQENGSLYDSFEELTHNRGQAHWMVVDSVFWIPLFEYWSNHSYGTTDVARELVNKSAESVFALHPLRNERMALFKIHSKTSRTTEVRSLTTSSGSPSIRRLRMHFTIGKGQIFHKDHTGAKIE